MIPTYSDRSQTPRLKTPNFQLRIVATRAHLPHGEIGKNEATSPTVTCRFPTCLANHPLDSGFQLGIWSILGDFRKTLWRVKSFNESGIQITGGWSIAVQNSIHHWDHSSVKGNWWIPERFVDNYVQHCSTASWQEIPNSFAINHLGWCACGSKLLFPSNSWYLFVLVYVFSFKHKQQNANFSHV